MASIETPEATIAKAIVASEEKRRREAERIARNKISTMFPDTGPYCRLQYPKHMEFFKASKEFKEVLFMAANRCGKSTAGGVAMAYHLTGEYPHWWEGRRFDKPIEAWACGTNSETTRDIVQNILLGPVDKHGTGMIPFDSITKVVPRRGGIAGSVETVGVKHKSGGTSYCMMKSYEQGRASFEGTSRQVIWCIAEGELVQMADGSLKPIEKIKKGDIVLSLDRDGNPIGRKATKAVDCGIKSCVRIEPKQGTQLVCTPDHEIYSGYSKENKIQAAMATKVAQIIPGWWPTHTADREDAWYVWAALVIAEGTIKAKKVTNGSIEVMEEAIRYLPVGAKVRRKNFAEHHKHVPDWHLSWDDFWKEWPPALSDTKEIPNWIFKSSREKVALFLRWLYMGDGWAYGHSICYATTSYRLANQVCVLLNRMGVRASVQTRKSIRATWKDQYWVSISRASEVLEFIRLIGIVGKAEAVGKVWNEATRRKKSKIVRSAHLIIHGRREYTARDDRKRLSKAKIHPVGDAGERRVFDITVEGEHRFLCGTSLVSNCDEEPPEDCYTEMLFRTATVRGIIFTTFTPLQGMSAVVKGFLEPENAMEAAKYKYYVQAGWKDVPHIPKEEMDALLTTAPRYQLRARTEGEPALGSGAVYPIAMDEITSELMTIPDSWPRAYGFDIGWNRSAAVWGARDPASGVIYIYSEHYQGMGEPASHAYAIKSRGEWIPGVIDPASNGRSQIDGRQLIDMYRKLGLKLQPADNSVEAGISEVWQLMVSGKLKIMPQCQNLLRELSRYHRDDKGSGKIVKRDDHACDACLRGDTGIITKEGIVPIASLVGKEGYVLSRSGSWARFIGARKTIENAELVCLVFSDGSEVVCTPDHTFLTPRGWKKAEEMMGDVCYNGVTQCIQSNHLLSSLQPVKNLKAFATTFAESISSGLSRARSVLSASMSACGPWLMAASPSGAMTSTIKTTIGSTTPMTISKNCSRLSICLDTQRESIGTSLQPHASLPPSGMDHQKALSGAASMPPRSIGMSSGNSFANIVQSHSRAKIWAATVFAQITAKRNGVVLLVLTIRNVLAWFVAHLLWLIGTLKQKHVRSRAVLNCVGIHSVENADVYCLTVPGTSAFCVENGAVVHNTRYLIISGRQRMIGPPRPPKSTIHSAPQGEKAWMS